MHRFQPNFARWQRPPNALHGWSKRAHNKFQDGGQPPYWKNRKITIPQERFGQILQLLQIITSPPGNGAKYCDQRVYMSVCLSARISEKPHLQTSRHFLYALTVAVGRSSSDDSAICYILPVLWMTSFFHIMEHYFRFAVVTRCLTASCSFVGILVHPHRFASWCRDEVCYPRPKCNSLCNV